MQPSILAVFFEFSSTAFSMTAAGLALLVIGLLAAKNDIIRARGIDKDHTCYRLSFPFGYQGERAGFSLRLCVTARNAFLDKCRTSRAETQSRRENQNPSFPQSPVSTLFCGAGGGIADF
jgi:hypothetical protein